MDISKAQRVPEPRSGTGGDWQRGERPSKTRSDRAAFRGGAKKPGQGKSGARSPKRTMRPTRSRFRRDGTVEDAGGYKARQGGRNRRPKRASRSK